MSQTCLMIVAGERSGDVYGAELARALGERLGAVEIFGCGGDAMRRAGVETTLDAHAISMAGIVEVVAGLPRSPPPAACRPHRFSRLQSTPCQEAEAARNSGHLLCEPAGLGVAQRPAEGNKGHGQQDALHIRF
jgi:hypothetical protein